MTNKEVRINLLKDLHALLDQNCCYSFQEQEVVKDCLKIIEQPNDRFEEYNEENPNHGKKCNNVYK